MTIKNSKNVEKYVEIVFEVENDKNKYVIYKDPVTNNMYAGRYKNNKILALDDEEYKYLNDILENINE